MKNKICLGVFGTEIPFYVDSSDGIFVFLWNGYELLLLLTWNQKICGHWKIFSSILNLMLIRIKLCNCYCLQGGNVGLLCVLLLLSLKVLWGWLGKWWFWKGCFKFWVLYRLKIKFFWMFFRIKSLFMFCLCWFLTWDFCFWNGYGLFLEWMLFGILVPHRIWC